MSVDKLCWLHSASGSRKPAGPSNEKDRVMTDAEKTRYHRHEPRNRGLRVSDAEREAVAAILRREHVAGRLDNVEFDERVSRCLTARSYAELDGLLTDLPIENHTPRLSTRFSPWPFPLLPIVPIAIAAIVLSEGHLFWLAFPIFFFVFRPRIWGHRVNRRRAYGGNWGL